MNGRPHWRHVARLVAMPAIYLAIIALYLCYARAADMEPYMVKDINPAGSSWPVYMAKLGGTFLTRAGHIDTGSELWRSDGTADGTWLLKDIFTGTSSSGVGPFTKLGDILLTRADDGVHGEELWRTDGTEEGTRLVKDINPGPEGSEPLEPAVVNGFMYFYAFDAIHGREVWKSDGTVTNTVMVKDINPAGDAISTYSDDDGVDLSGEFVFPASDGSHGFELWRSDGTAQNTEMIFDINPGGSSDPAYLTVVDGTLFFAANDGTHGPALWKSQGSASDTEMVADIYPGASGDPYLRTLTESGGTLFFSARDDTHGQELWKTDGTVTGTVMVADIEPSGNSSPEQLIDVDGRLFFVADTYDHGSELWVSDGTVTGTVLVRDIHPGEEDSSPYYLAEANGYLFFQANDGVHGVELWMSDGTEEGTQMVADINPGAADAGPGDEDMLFMNGTLFFYADDGVHGGELWALPWENIRIEKSVVPSTLVKPGTPITYSLAFRNTGFGTAVGVVITDVIPVELVDVDVDSNLTLTPTGGISYVWRVGDLAPGESGAITISGVVDPSAGANYSLTNQAIIYSPLGDLLKADNRSTVTTSVICRAPAAVSLQRVPRGDLFAGNTVRFMAEALGDTPLAYAWALNGSPAVESSSTFEHRFQSQGAYTVSVTVANVCGQGADTMTVEVQEAVDQPDLSPSYKSVSLGNVEPGERLTYSLILRNGSPITATALVTDPIPANTTYVPGTARASDGSAVTVTGGVLHWSGEVISGTPVLLDFGATVDYVPYGATIRNVATINDGLDNVVEFEASSVHRPGFWLSINEGDWFTSIPTVTLRYSWKKNRGITHVRFSNDWSFGPSGNTTPWLEVDSAYPVYEEWVLPVETRWWFWPFSVHAQFRDENGRVYGPFRDRIMYDPTPPTWPFWIWLWRFSTPTAEGSAAAPGPADVIVQVRGSDGNSGINRVQISHAADFAEFEEYEFVGPTSEFPWTLQASGEVFVRLVDRAGNISQVGSAQGEVSFSVYLPVVLKSPD